MNKLKTTFTFLLTILFLLIPQTAQAAEDFNDIPQSHWAYSQVMKLKELGVTAGVGNNNFGTGQTITRAEFVTFLSNLMQWKSESGSGDYLDNTDKSKWYSASVTNAYSRNLTGGEKSHFRPGDNITREEMAVMLINSLGLDYLADRFSAQKSVFSDVTGNAGYISIAKDLGIISGMSQTTFGPAQTATREQAAAMMVRMYNLLQNKTDELNGFYAIRSANQMGAVASLDTLSFGWCALETDGAKVWLNTTASGGNEYNIPAGFEQPWNMAAGKNRLLMIAVKDEYSSLVINNPALRAEAEKAIASILQNGLGEEKIFFDGIVLDFETLKGGESRNSYNAFVKQLRSSIGTEKLIYIAVHPARYNQQYYDGYDFKVLGEQADKIILMAHDYNPKSLTPEEMAMGLTATPIAPIDGVYEALKAITDENTGVQDRGRVMLQISFSSCQWKVQDSGIINSKPYTPDYSAIMNRINSDPNAEVKYSNVHQSPYLTFYNEEDSTNNIVWYENEQSVAEKMRLALLFGINDFSFWRIGTIPDYNTANLNVYGAVLK